ncbi:BRO family protein [Niallia sp. RD1]|uniref:BRO family protein n=1 Tax=Niallia sp. RD1 TaxID=2962858 RepID=UPI0020C191AB|nr:BRO family protein [Niallia sp. RD1]UTI42118.1 BRO family protein [Niallia sp. RD1]
MKLVRQASFGTLTMDFYMDSEKEVWATRKQIGEALGYANPQKAIDNLHAKYSDRLDGFSVTLNLRGTDNKSYPTMLYNSKGIMEVCRKARTDKADDFFDWVSDIINELRVNGVVVSENASHEQVIYNVDTFIANLDNYNVTKLYDLIEDFMNHHRDKKTRLRYKRNHKARHGNKKLKTHIESMQEIRDYLVDYLTVQINHFNNTNQSGLSQEYIRIREMVRVNVENMKFRTAACKK